MQVAAQLHVFESQCHVLKLTSEIEEEVSALIAHFNEKPSSYSVIINRL